MSTPSEHKPTSTLLRFLPKTVRGAVLIALIVGLAIPSFVAYLFERQITESAAQAELKKDLEHSANVLALSMSPLLWELSRENAEALVLAMINDDKFLSIQVFDKLNPEPFVDLQRQTGSAQDSAQLKRPVAKDGNTIGYVIVTMSLKPYLLAGQRALQWNMIRIGTAIGLAIILILLVLQHHLFGPIRQLTAAANRIASQDLSAPISLHSSGEFGDVSKAMEQMRVALLSTFEELRSKNEQLAEHAQTLEQRVSERTEALLLSNGELNLAMTNLQKAQAGLVESEKLASLGRLVAGVAHELNTPIGNALTTVSTLSDFYRELQEGFAAGTLKRSTMDEILQNTREGQDMIFRNLHKAAEIIQHFKQLAIDQTTDMRRSFDLAVTVDEVLFSIRPNFKHGGVQIESDVEAGIRMDSFPGPLGQVLTNLALNALFHAFPDTAKGNIHISARRDGETHITLTCSDDGCGMTPEIRRHVFDPFFTTRLGRGGSGLGLHIVRSIVTGLLGGSIELQTEPDKGSSFIISLPITAPIKEIVEA